MYYRYYAFQHLADSLVLFLVQNISRPLIRVAPITHFSLIVPDLKHDAHDGTTAMADRWLKENIASVLRSQYFLSVGHGVMFITFDNGDGDRQGQVFTAVIGAAVIPRSKVDQAFRHENTLRTMMELLGLKHFPVASAKAAPKQEFFK